MVILLNLSPTSNHLHPLQVENCDTNPRLVVDEDDNGKFRLERFKRSVSISYVKAGWKPFYIAWTYVIVKQKKAGITDLRYKLINYCICLAFCLAFSSTECGVMLHEGQSGGNWNYEQVKISFATEYSTNYLKFTTKFQREYVKLLEL